MERGNYSFFWGQDTITQKQGIIQIKSTVKISLDPLNMPSSDGIHILDESKMIQQPVKPKKQYNFRKSLENEYVRSDSTLRSRIPSDYILQQIAVQPKGIILPSRPFGYHSTDWFTFLLFFSLILFVFVRNSSEKYFPLLFKSITNYLVSSKLFREQNISLMQGSAIMELFYLIVLGLFGFQLIKYFGLSLPFSGFIAFLICFGAIMFFFLLKLLAYKILGFVSETLPDTNEFLFNMKNHNKVLGILLLPLVSFAAWSPAWNPKFFLIAGLILIALFYLIYLVRGMKILLKKHYSIFYLFLYLCTLEILPLLLLIKII
jgi:hypothetical protein